MDKEEELVLDGYSIIHQLSQRRSLYARSEYYTNPWECRVTVEGEEFDAVLEWNAGDLYIKAKDGSRAYVMTKPSCVSLKFSFDDATVDENVTLVGNNRHWSGESGT